MGVEGTVPRHCREDDDPINQLRVEHSPAPVRSAVGYHWEIRGQAALDEYREKFVDRYVENFSCCGAGLPPQSDSVPPGGGVGDRMRV